ncbi:shikimate dehydrogenase [Paenibacillus sp. HWE-109]|uniref:shikimate dehydrogenase family protein n=1 Tax=Paenibacillus sp. HWE-109 TaxID=1306526 RepID=UPI001EDC97A9|nr:shikimate dehydrogenase [Paenibacillus sp. HWE-109]UKS28277.1 shikimate dehydrogenase [Paenibacillus sp. HWE-109]
MLKLQKAERPTLYFIGVTTAQSSIMKLFPLWAKALGLKDAIIRGIDIGIHADADLYREAVEFIKNDELSLGALVTTHKIDLYHAAKDLFDYLDPYATMFGELSCISKKDGRLEGYAKDPISSGLALEAFVPEGYWEEHGGELFVMGAGGSAIAISAYLLDPRKKDRPTKLIVSNRSKQRLDEIERIMKLVAPDVAAAYYLTPESAKNDEILSGLKPHSLVVNATGLGKDQPGSPITDEGCFPSQSLVWELNYRGALDYLHQANRQKEGSLLHVEDGWIYFIHGWTQVIQEVFHLDIDPAAFAELESIAGTLR